MFLGIFHSVILTIILHHNWNGFFFIRQFFYTISLNLTQYLLFVSMHKYIIKLKFIYKIRKYNVYLMNFWCCNTCVIQSIHVGEEISHEEINILWIQSCGCNVQFSICNLEWTIEYMTHISFVFVSHLVFFYVAILENRA